MTDETLLALCGRLPALTSLDLQRVKSLTADGLSVVGGLTALTHLNLSYSPRSSQNQILTSVVKWVLLLPQP